MKADFNFQKFFITKKLKTGEGGQIFVTRCMRTDQVAKQRQVLLLSQRSNIWTGNKRCLGYCERANI